MSKREGAKQQWETLLHVQKGILSITPSSYKGSLKLGRHWKSYIFALMEFSKKPLATGWTFRDRDAEGWMPVPAVPSVVHQDLMANNK